MNEINITGQGLEKDGDIIFKTDKGIITVNNIRFFLNVSFILHTISIIWIIYLGFIIHQIGG